MKLPLVCVATGFASLACYIQDQRLIYALFSTICGIFGLLVMPEEENEGKFSVERLVHFHCVSCEKCWSVGDAPDDQVWHCPWCGVRQKCREISPK